MADSKYVRDKSSVDDVQNSSHSKQKSKSPKNSKNNNNGKKSIMDLFCVCCKKSSKNKSEVLLEESMEHMQRVRYTIYITNQFNKGTGIKVESTLQGPRVVRITDHKWNSLQEMDKILSINDENCVDSSPEVVQFLLMNLYNKNEAIFELERGVSTLKVGIRRENRGFGFDFKKSSENTNYIVVNQIHDNQSNDVQIGDKILSINDVDAGMINCDDLQSMLDTPGSNTKLIIERLTPIN